MYEAKIIADSICAGQRLTTMQLTHPRIVHAEFMTHAMFARNASSSRAIPFKTMVQRVIDDPYIPRTFGRNQKGMQPGGALTGRRYELAKTKWLMGRDRAVETAYELADDVCEHCKGKGHTGAGEFGQTCQLCEGDGLGLNVHKETVNRLLEPWGWITVATTGMWRGCFTNYFGLRCHPMAAEALRDQAFLAQKAYFLSTPRELKIGEWHTPYLDVADGVEVANHYAASDKAMVEISSGRCARTSYLTQEGERDFQEDVKLHDRLAFNQPMHASPFEHVCQAMGDDKRYAKFVGWKSYRHTLPNECIMAFVPNHPDLIEIDGKWHDRILRAYPQ